MKGVDIREVGDRNAGASNELSAFRDFFGTGEEPTRAVLEAGRTWGVIYDLLEGIGVQPILANPLKTRAIAEAKIKTDKISEDILADLLRTDLIPGAYAPSKGTSRSLVTVVKIASGAGALQIAKVSLWTERSQRNKKGSTALLSFTERRNRGHETASETGRSDGSLSPYPATAGCRLPALRRCLTGHQKSPAGKLLVTSPQEYQNW